MKIIKTILMLSVFVVINACESPITHETKYYSDFPNTIQLNSNSIDGISKDFFTPFIGLKDSLLIFCDTESSPHFHIYQLPDFAPIGNFGVEGYGPSDISTPVFWNQMVKKGDTYQLWFFQLDLMRLTKIDIAKYLNNSEALPEYEIELPPEIDQAVNIIALNDSIIIGTGYAAKGAFFKYNINADSFSWIEYPKRDEKANLQDLLIENDLYEEYNLGIIRIKPDGSRFVKSNLYRPTLDVYDHACKLLFSLEKSTFTPLKLEANTRNMPLYTNLYYSNLFLTDSHIYALHYNCTLSQMGNDECQDVEIHVFDWTGNPICKYLLNDGIHPFGSFVVDEANKKIYTINPKDEDHYYYQYDIDH